MDRRQLLTRSLGLGTAALLPAWARSDAADLSGERMLNGREFDLSVSAKKVRIDGKSGNAVLVNGQLPAPLLRWREGDDLTLRVANRLKVDTSIHWHGILLPFQMDGVPGLTFPGIKPGRTFTYNFDLKQSGTYWYHSHSGLQEQAGHYGPIIVEPRDGYAEPFDREYIVMLSDWTFENPHRVFAKLKKMSDNYNFQQRTVGDFFRDAERRGLDNALEDRQMWGAMRMNPTDIADVTGSTYTYLVNGHGPKDNWTGLFKAGERVRLRFINAAAMSIFNVRIPGLPMRVVAADGLDVQSVDTDEFQIGVAETFDVIVAPNAERAYTIVAESNDRSGMARATLAPRPGMTAAVPTLRSRPTLTMKDMAMEHGEMDHAAMGHGETASADMDHAAMGHGKKADTGMDHAAMGHGKKADTGMDHAAMGHGKKTNSGTAHVAAQPIEPERQSFSTGPGVVALAMNPVNRLGERPLGLENEPHRVLVYTDLRSREPNPDTRPAGREIELHLTSNMERYMWSFDGVKFSEVDGPIVFHEGERLRLTMVNDTMMPHPIHLHGMFFDVVTAEHNHKPRKHTIVVKPGEKMSVDVTADALGDWAFHCHLLYHMHAGMMRVVSVRPRATV
ncbi:MAG: copper resistance system multicopper oxidase [Pseudomonadota bacterium]